MVTPTIDLSAFTVFVAKFIKNEVEKRFFEEAKMDSYVSNKTFVGHETKEEDESPTEHRLGKISESPDGYI